MKQKVTLFRCNKRNEKIGDGMCCLTCKDKAPDYVNKKTCRYEEEIGCYFREV